MASRKTHKLYLKVSAFLVASFGPIFFLGTFATTREPLRLTADMLVWPIDGAQTFDHPDTIFLGALTGGFLMGWGVLIWFLSGDVFDAAPEGVRKAVVAGFIAWFLLDSAGSIASGNASNALFNIPILLAFVGPLWRPATD
ncbi:MAG: hypothetical protein QNI84_09275 [Henriciella sp.]|nr:hypothetical protein [Henriciella sp.]